MSHRFFLSLLLLVSFASTAALADSPAKISEDYHKQSAAALVKLNDTLEKATTPLIAALIKAGDTAGAEQLTGQLKAKTAGEPVPTPHASATLLFAQYDQARGKALEPAQKAAVARIEAMLNSKEGGSLEVVAELGKVRAEIEAGKAAPAPPAIPMAWNYYTGIDKSRLVGELLLSADGTLALNTLKADGTPYMVGNPKRPAGSPGLWERTKNNVLKITLTPPGEREEFEMIITDKNAVMKRAVGDRFLTAKE
ncbi:hypothetical protein [Prosthecobacter fluviatilis]|uniref:Uncharacterized protein n=1 Tax=Prosthecobacter fluviatilis TaxID=445931 RepID=A0ABW0KXS2_9BACT